MRLLFTALACFVFATLFPVDNATVSYGARMSYRPDDGRSYSNQSKLICRADLAQYKCFSPSYSSHAPVRNSRSASPFAPDAAHNVFLRCTVINFLNVPLSPYQTIAPPQLPQGFSENFEKSWYVRERSVEYFQNQFQNKLRELGLHHQHKNSFPYQRAEMRRWDLYNSCAFREFLNSLYVYQDYILEIAAQFEHDAEFVRAVAYVCKDAQKWICAQAHHVRCLKRAQDIQREQQQFEHDVYHTFMEQPAWVDDDTRIFYEDYEAYDGSRFIKRAQAEIAIKQRGVDYTKNSYVLGREAAALLRALDVHDGPYYACYGNQLQQVIHQECVDLLERTAQLKPE